VQHYRVTGGQFEILGQYEGGQVASMVLAAGATSGDYGNEHPSSIQILIVISGHGSAKVEGRDMKLAPGDVLVVEKGEKHQFRSSTGLRTLSIYLPPAYDAEGKPLEAK
jgi:mannose-6-phosphate isomerase-like protein (cupin superfamily)